MKDYDKVLVTLFGNNKLIRIAEEITILNMDDNTCTSTK